MPTVWLPHYLVFPVASEFLHSLKAFFADLFGRDIAESLPVLTGYQYVAFGFVEPSVAESVNVAYFPFMNVGPPGLGLQACQDLVNVFAFECSHQGSPVSGVVFAIAFRTGGT